jgi:hypothetical protein
MIMQNFRKAFALLTASTALTLPLAPAHAQAVRDRVLSDVSVQTIGSCSVLTINLNVRVQVLSSFPQTSGRELHIRIKPLDDLSGTASNSTGVDGTSGRQAREALRPPEGVKSLRAIDYERENAAGPLLSLYFKDNVQFNVISGKSQNAIMITIAERGSIASCEEDAPATLPVPGGDAPESAASEPGVVRPPMAIPSGLFVVNLASQPKQVAELTAAQQGKLGSAIVYESRFEREGQTWFRLRAGFYDTRDEAEAVRTKLLKDFPQAWVIKVSAQEREQGVLTRRLDVSTAPVTGTAAVTGAPMTADESAAATKALSDAETALKAGENDRAIQLLTKVLSYPEHENTARALELLGLTRERKGQAAHATAEYEEYVRRYPGTEGAERVRQRLAALKSPTDNLPPELRGVTEKDGKELAANAWRWGVRGSFSQFYFRDQSTTKFVDANPIDPRAEVDNSVNLNQLLSTADVTVTGGNDRNMLSMRAAGSFTKNFRAGGRDIKTLSALYLDYQASELGLSTRLGRQTKNSAGVLGRFDGALFGWQAKPRIRLNAVAGVPVLSSRQTRILKDRLFYGTSVDYGARNDKFQGSLYWFDQRSRGLVDRRSIGTELRYVDKQFNAYSMIDYDVHYNTLNLALFTLNYSFKDQSSLSVTADYRKSPLLTTNNALMGQADPISFAPIIDLRDLRGKYSDNFIYQLAQDRTLVAKSLTVSYSRPLTKSLQSNLDVTITKTGGTPASGGVDAQPRTGTEYFYGAQLIGSGLLMANDIYIFSLRHARTQRALSYTADVNARIPLSTKFRLSPRLRYGMRDDRFTKGTYRQLQPTLRLNYYPFRQSEVELEIGGNFTRQKSFIGTTSNRTTEKGLLINLGYRLDF